MDVKSAFLNGYIKENVYVEQPPLFTHEKFPDHVFKLKNALYGLNKHHVLGTNDSRVVLSHLVFKLERLIKHFLLNIQKVIF